MILPLRVHTLRLPLLAVFFCALAIGNAFHPSLSYIGRGNGPRQSCIPRFVTFKTSPATASIQEGEVVRRILKRRSNRGKTKPVEERPPHRQRPVVPERVPTFKKKPRARISDSSKVRASNLGRTAKGVHLSYESTISALKIYYDKNSHLIFPRRFVIEDTAYPKEWQGLDLAGTVYDMVWWQRHVKQKPDRVAELNKMGFIWERLQPEWNLVLEALITYRAIHGDLLVPAKFVVPYEDPRWPKATWGSNLGNSVYRMRNRGDFLQGGNAWSRRDQLDSIGFVWDVHEHRFKKFHEAIRIYAQLVNRDNFGNRPVSLKVPTNFIVPENSEWPEEFWGYNLGTKCTDIRTKEVYIKGHPERLKMLADLGFHIGGNDSLGWLEVVHAAAVYSQMNDRKLDVPVKFVVPAPPRRVADNLSSTGTSVVGSDAAWPWPEYLWGFPLGQRLKDIRVKGNYLRGEEAGARRRQLDALGFNWAPKRGRPRRRALTVA